MASLLFLTLASCFHRSPDEAVLAPLVAELGQAPFDKSNQPEYLVFADERTANVFKSLKRDPRYKIVPTGKPFVCPSDVSPCPQLHELRARVDSITGATAIATIERIYSGSGGGHRVAYGEQFLLVRLNGKWKLVRVLGYSAVVM